MTGLAWDWAPGEIVRAGWDPELHPRGYHGKWTGKGGKLPFSTSGAVTNYHGSMGIDRADMPQLSGLVNGQYVPSAHMVPKFMANLRTRGISVHEHRVPAESLKPTQTTGDTAAIRRIADNLKSGELPDTKPITVSQDGRVLDGHHNWAGRVLADSEGSQRDMRVVRVGLPMDRLLAEARGFAKREGIASRKTGEIANPQYAAHAARALWKPSLHPRVPSGHGGGEFTHVGGEDRARAEHLRTNAGMVSVAAGNARTAGRLTDAADALDAGEYSRASGALRAAQADLQAWSPDRKFRGLHKSAKSLVADHLAYAEHRAKSAPDYQRIRGMEAAAGIGSERDRQQADTLRAEEAAVAEFAPGTPHLAAAARALDQSEYADALAQLDALYQQVAAAPHRLEESAARRSPRQERLMARLEAQRQYVRQAMAALASRAVTRAALLAVDSPLGRAVADHRGDAAEAATGRVGVSRGLTWDGAELLLRAAEHWDPRLHPRGRHGEFEHGAGLGAGPVAGPQEPTAAELAKMVTGLQKQFADAQSQMKAEHAAELGRVVSQLRQENDRLTQLGDRTAEVKGEADARRKEVIHSIINILSLVAVGALILATAGAALPPLAAAGVAVGPLIGGEVLHTLRQAKPHAGREVAAAGQAAETAGKAAVAAEAKAAAETAKMLAKVTGADEAEARRLAEQLIKDAKAARSVAEGVTVRRSWWNPRLHPRGPHGEWIKVEDADSLHGQQVEGRAWHGGIVKGAYDRTDFSVMHAGLKRTPVNEVRPLPGGRAVKPLGGIVAESDGNDSVAKHMNPDGTWPAERAALHQKIVDETLAGVKPGKSPAATFLGGGSAAGKSTVLAGKVQNAAHIDADAIKEKLPEYGQMVKAGDKGAAAYVHEESSYLAKAIQAKAAAQKMDYLVDGTGDGSIQSMRKKIAQARAAGHKVVAKYVTVDTDEAVRRAKARAAQTGRMVPESVIRKIHAGVSDVFPQLLKEGAFDQAELWDTGGPKPVRVGYKPDGGTWKVEDQAAWERFLAKAHEI